MTLLIALLMLASAQFQTVDYDIQCREVLMSPQAGRASPTAPFDQALYLVEYRTDPDETMPWDEDEVERALDLTRVLAYDPDSHTVVGLSRAGCWQLH